MAKGVADWFDWKGQLDPDEFLKRALILVVGNYLLVAMVHGYAGQAAWLLFSFLLSCALARGCRQQRLNPWLGLLGFVPVANVVLAVVLMVK
jgi:hypothetical protein